MRSVEGCVVVSLSRTPAASVSPGNSCRQGAQTHFQLTLTDSGAEIKDIINQVRLTCLS